MTKNKNSMVLFTIDTIEQLIIANLIYLMREKSVLSPFKELDQRWVYKSCYKNGIEKQYSNRVRKIIVISIIAKINMLILQKMI